MAYAKVKAPTLEVSNVQLTQGTPTPEGIPYDLTFTIKATDDVAMKQVDINKYGGSGWVRIKRLNGVQEIEFGFGYSGRLPPGEYYFGVRVTDMEDNGAYVNVEFEITAP